jgi:hypothetical protein
MLKTGKLATDAKQGAPIALRGLVKRMNLARIAGCAASLAFAGAAVGDDTFKLHGADYNGGDAGEGEDAGNYDQLSTRVSLDKDGRSIDLTLTADSLRGNEFVKSWSIGVNPELPSLSYSIKSRSGDFASPNLHWEATESNRSLTLDFGSTGGDSLRFTKEDSVTIVLTSDSLPLTLEQFENIGAGGLACNATISSTTDATLAAVLSNNTLAAPAPEPSTWAAAGFVTLAALAGLRKRMVAENAVKVG